jgi:hypothetical protein
VQEAENNADIGASDDNDIDGNDDDEVASR